MTEISAVPAYTPGLAPYRFCAFHFPGTPVWNRDIDRSAPDGLLTAVAEQARLPLARVIGMTLRRVEANLGAHAANGTAPWLNALGIYHRLRRRWGQQYCPDCLAEHPVFYRSWRLSFVVVCVRHRGCLQDACPHCDAQVAIRRQQLSAQLCQACSRSLAVRCDGLRTSLEALRRAQAHLEHVMACGRAQIGQGTIPAHELFRGAHVLASLVVPPRVDDADGPRARRLPLEFARTEERARTLLQLDALLARWPAGFSAAAHEHRLTQRSFARWSLPAWLAKAVRQLPEGNMRGEAFSRGPQTLRRRLWMLRRHAADWRTVRAELLWRAATR